MAAVMFCFFASFFFFFFFFICNILSCVVHAFQKLLLLECVSILSLNTCVNPFCVDLLKTFTLGNNCFLFMLKSFHTWYSSSKNAFVSRLVFVKEIVVSLNSKIKFLLSFIFFFSFSLWNYFLTLYVSHLVCIVHSLFI